MRMKLSRRLLKKLKILLEDDAVDVWMEDEVQFKLAGSRCKMWIPPEEKDPVVRHHPSRKAVGYFGAVRLRDGKFVYQKIDESFNGKTCFDFLRKLRNAGIRSGRKVVVVLDNARYHHARLHKEWREKCSNRFELVFLPPYSPELNTIERVWKLTRRKKLHNRYFFSLQDITESVEQLFARWCKSNPTLRKLCAFN